MLQLIRPANVATALADVLAGYAVTGLPVDSRLAWLVPAGACLYAGGVVLNDVFDRQLDAVERPERPLPSGRISVATAGFLGAGLLAAGVLLALGAGRTPAVVALATALVVLLYDAWGKHRRFIGPFNMGLCRALNLMLGVSAAPAVLPTAWPLGCIPLVYIAGVTVVSRGEVHGAARRVPVVALVMVGATVAALAGLAASRASTTTGQLAAFGLVGVLGWRVLPAFWRAVQDTTPGTIRLAVRTGVLSLVLVDAVIATTYADMIYGLAVLATGLVAVRLARLFAVT
jgi:4-hydroxybenzoate polyprenyltransferase